MKNLTEVTRSFLTHCIYEKNLSDKTIEAYRIDLNQFKIFTLSNFNVKAITQIDKLIVRSYVEHINVFKPKTIKRKIASLKALFSFCEFEDIIVVNPFRKMRIRIKEPKQLPISMTNHEVEQIITESYKELNKRKPSGGYLYNESLRNVAILELLFATGIRVSELCGLNKIDVNLDLGTIKVNGKGGKERIIQVCHDEALGVLRKYEIRVQQQITTNKAYFINRLGNRISDQSVRLMIRKYVRAAQISKVITPHTFRHTFATLLLEEDVDIRYIQNMLGHSSIMVTQIYTHVSKKKQGELLSVHHPRKHFTIPT